MKEILRELYAATVVSNDGIGKALIGAAECLYDARLELAEAENKLADAERKRLEVRAEALERIDPEQITGKTKDERAEQVERLLAADPGYAKAVAKVNHLEAKVRTLDAEIRALTDVLASIKKLADLEISRNQAAANS